jgi:hypothetical protein
VISSRMGLRGTRATRVQCGKTKSRHHVYASAVHWSRMGSQNYEKASSTRDEGRKTRGDAPPWAAALLRVLLVRSKLDAGPLRQYITSILTQASSFKAPLHNTLKTPHDTASQYLAMRF